ncbi:hypothetical protein GCM10027217_43260 [Pseudomaricurvus hydrocarbonicus]
MIMGVGLGLMLLAVIGLGVFNAGKISEREKPVVKAQIEDSLLGDPVGFDDSRYNGVQQPTAEPEHTVSAATQVKKLPASNWVSLNSSGSARIQSSQDENKRVEVKSSTSNSNASSYSKAASNNTAALKKKAATEYRKHQQVYAALQKTCNNWTGWYNRDRTQSAAFQMNVSCKDAANYSAKHLNVRVTPNHVVLNSPANTSRSGNRAILIGDEANHEANAYCESLEREKRAIRAKRRAGYTASEDNYLRARLRKVSELINENC